MKNYILFILLFLTSFFKLGACGPWYPFGDDARFTIFYFNKFNKERLTPFQYSSGILNHVNPSEIKENKNITLWFEYCNGNVSKESIFETIYQLSFDEVEKSYNSEMMSYLFKKNDIEAIDYIKFAKSCSNFNSSDFDPWEWESDFINEQRKKKIKSAMKKAEYSKNKQLNKRYYFLGLRMAFYDNDYILLNEIYNNFLKEDTVDLLTNWARYYTVIIKPNSLERNIELADLLIKCPSKSVSIVQYFDYSISENEIDKKQVLFMYGLKDIDQSFSKLKKLAETAPNSFEFRFLLAREVNKIEDWCLSPRYQKFPPSLSKTYYEEEQSVLYQKRINKDKKYALDLANLIGALPSNSSQNRLIIGYLYFIGGKNKKSLEWFRLINATKNEQVFFDKISLLIKIQSDKNDAFEIVNQVKNKRIFEDEMFLFATAREFEYVNEMTVSALMYSKLNYWSGYNRMQIPWKGNRKVKPRYYYGFYTDYFSYIDDQYTATEVDDIIEKYNNHSEDNDWLFESIIQDEDKLLDLLGTKYLREDKLKLALSSFEKVKQSFWENEDYIGYLNANPFYTDFYTEHSGSKADTIKYNKAGIVKKLIQLKNKADNGDVKAAFLTANCYLNISYYGNSWIMQNYWWTANFRFSNNNKDDFFTCERAQKYYLKAFEFSNKQKVKALCIAMAGRCEKYKLYQSVDEYSYWDQKKGDVSYHQYIFSKNRFYHELKQDYLEDYNTIIGNCETFSEYFNQI